MTAVATRPAHAPASVVMWRQARQLRVASLNRRLEEAIRRRDEIHAGLLQELDSRWRAVRDQFPGNESMQTVLIARDLRALAVVWDAAELSLRRNHDWIVRALLSQAEAAAPVTA